MDSIYIVGNAFKNTDYKGHYQIKWLNRRMKISKKFFLISTNYGPANNDLWRIDCHNAFSKMTDVCFRDRNSFNKFSELNNVRYAPDAVLSLKSEKNNVIINLKKDYIIISVIDCLMKNRNDKLKASANIYEKKMIELINELNKKNIDVILLNSNTIQDQPASKRIYDNCSNKERVSVFNYDGNLEKIFELFTNAKGIIATRLHTIILGWLYNIPVIPIVYDIKVEYLLKSYEFNGIMKNITDLENLNISLIIKAIENYNFKISKKIILDANDQFKMIDKLLK